MIDLERFRTRTFSCEALPIQIESQFRSDVKRRSEHGEPCRSLLASRGPLRRLASRARLVYLTMLGTKQAMFVVTLKLLAKVWRSAWKTSIG